LSCIFEDKSGDIQMPLISITEQHLMEVIICAHTDRKGWEDQLNTAACYIICVDLFTVQVLFRYMANLKLKQK